MFIAHFKQKTKFIKLFLLEQHFTKVTEIKNFIKATGKINFSL